MEGGREGGRRWMQRGEKIGWVVLSFDELVSFFG